MQSQVKAATCRVSWLQLHDQTVVSKLLPLPLPHRVWPEERSKQAVGLLTAPK
jgi:hypothetical protein